MIITMDGGAATGKSTLAKALAKRLGCAYIDAGLMFRAVALALLEQRDKIEIKFHEDQIYLNGKNVTVRVRDVDVTEFAAQVGGKEEFRNLVYSLEREQSKDRCTVISGRDAGSKVFPNAEYKFYIEAPIDMRASRRYEDYKKKIELDEIKRSILERDQKDINYGSLIKPKDAHVIENSKSLEEALAKIISLIKALQ